MDEHRDATESDPVPDNQNDGVPETPENLNFENSHPHTGDGASPSKIFIGGLARETTSEQFIKYFGKYGEITDSVIMKDRNTGQPRGFGFVSYADASVVDRVIEETHIINGKQVEIKRTIPRGAHSKDFKTKKIFVGGIPTTISEGEIFEEEKVEEEEVEVEEEEVEVEVEKVEVEEEVEVEEVKEEWVEKVHKWLFKEEEDMTWETYRYCSNWNTIERSILMKTIHNFAKANRPKDYWKVRMWMNLSDTYNEMAVRTNQIKRSYHEIIGGGKYLQSLFTIERQPCNECRNRIPVFPKSLLYNGSNPSTSFGSRTDSSSHSKKQWTPDELELLKSTISDFSSASMPKPYWDVQLWTDLSETYNVQARFKNLNTVSYLEFISGGMQLQSIFCEERLSNALHGFGSRGRDFVLMKIFEPCLECRKRIPVFPNGLPNNGSTSSASSSSRSVQSHFTSYEDESYSATLNNMLIVVREMFEKGLLTSAQLSIVTLKLHDFAQTETWKVCLLNNIFTLEMKREVLIQSISPEA